MNKCNVIFISFIFVLLFNMGYAGDVRFSGMGNLSFIFQDDFHKLDLYDFAGISAGFFSNDSISFVGLRASGLKESWEKDSLTYLAIGQAIPQRLTDYAPVEAVSFYEVIPQFNLVPCELIYVSSYNYGQFDSDLDDIIDADDCIITNTLTSGLGINFLKNTRIDLAYNYKWAKTDLDPEEKITDHIISLYLKYALISESY